MSYEFKATVTFWRAYAKLSPFQKVNAHEAFEIFKVNPFDQRLKTHKIEKLFSRLGRTVYSVTVENNLRAVFFIKGNVVYTFDIGTHDIYR